MKRLRRWLAVKLLGSMPLIYKVEFKSRDEGPRESHPMLPSLLTVKGMPANEDLLILECMFEHHESNCTSFSVNGPRQKGDPTPAENDQRVAEITEQLQELAKDVPADEWKKIHCQGCGGYLVKIRGKVPGDPDRKVCPTCLQERVDDVVQQMSGPPAQANPEARA